jgi:hypothetical protein
VHRIVYHHQQHRDLLLLSFVCVCVCVCNPAADRDHLSHPLPTPFWRTMNPGGGAAIQRVKCQTRERESAKVRPSVRPLSMDKETLNYERCCWNW